MRILNSDWSIDIDTVFLLVSLESLLSKAEELQSVRQRLSADMADHSGVIRSLVVR